MRNSPMKKIRRAFDREALKRICEMPEEMFAAEYDMETVFVDQEAPADFYHFRDNGSNILAVAHLDTVGAAADRGCNFLHTAGGEVVYSRALDDRLGAYIILDLLPKLGIQYDWLLTVGEESGQSTAGFFEPPKEYDWAIEFDRGGTDVVLYQYEDAETEDLVKASGARVGDGSFSDISYLEHMEVKCFNWGVGYRDYHGPRAHAYLDDTFMMVNHYLRFHEANKETYLPHEKKPVKSWYGAWESNASNWRDDDRDAWWRAQEKKWDDEQAEAEELIELDARDIEALDDLDDLVSEYPSRDQIEAILRDA